MRTKLFILVLALQSAWILGTSLMHERALVTGTIIRLETRRVDPRDLLRGDYLILNYTISDVPANLFSTPGTKAVPAGADIFVALAPGTNGFYEVTRASLNEFAPAPGEVLLRGQSESPRWNTANAVHVAYGIEKYYVAEGTGNPSGKLTVEAAVPTTGRPVIKQVFVDGKPYAEVMKHHGD